MAESLPKTQRNHSQIEKEALAPVTAVERFKKFIWSRHFILQTDHQPLPVLFRPSNMKGLSERTAARLRRWVLRLVGFDFEIEYVLTDDFGQVDALSRSIQEARADAHDPDLEEVLASIDTDCEKHLQGLVVDALASEQTRKVVVDETAKDPVLAAVKTRLQTGWLEGDKKDPSLRPSESLCLTYKFVFSGDRVVIPVSIRSKVLEELHRGHPGIRRMKFLARSHFF